MPRFVILRHETPPGHARPLHWDLMLEAGDVLRTWALEREPEPNCEIAAELLPDHRLAYLTYEGPVSHNRGSVTRWDAGEYHALEESPQRLRLIVKGSWLRGIATLQRTETNENGGSQCWVLSLYLM